jgi:hypothetical protein
MTKPNIFDGTEQRVMTKPEHEQWLEDCAGFEAAAVAADQLAAIRVSALAKLAALGLTDDEIAALVG